MLLASSAVEIILRFFSHLLASSPASSWLPSPPPNAPAATAASSPSSAAQRKPLYQRLKGTIIALYICAHKMTGSYDLNTPNCARVPRYAKYRNTKKKLNFSLRDFCCLVVQVQPVLLVFVSLPSPHQQLLVRNLTLC